MNPYQKVISFYSEFFYYKLRFAFFVSSNDEPGWEECGSGIRENEFAEEYEFVPPLLL